MATNPLSRKISKSRAFVAHQTERWRELYEPKSEIDLTVFGMMKIFDRALKRTESNSMRREADKNKPKSEPILK